MEITEKEFAVIREISNNHLPDQRAIAQRTGISLGLTNIIIKRLITKGYIKAKQLDRKKIQYILTPKGFSEKANKSYAFTLRTIGIFKSIREKLQEIILSEYDKGVHEFTLSGTGELADMVEIALKNLHEKNIRYMRQNNGTEISEKTLLKVHGCDRDYSIDIMNIIVESGLFYK